MSDPYNVKVTKGPDFQPIAEALTINTDQIVGAVVQSDVVVTLYTPQENGRGDVYRAILKRDEDQILRVAQPPEVIENFWAEFNSMMEPPK